ncbi:MAG: YraN family protein [Nitrospirota bacterium]
MLTDAQQFGQHSEAAAADCLRAAGYRIVARNYRHRLGEIDLIAYDGATLVFVEVKARRSDRFGAPGESITRRKRDQLTKVALAYLARAHRRAPPPCRFDLVTVRPAPDGAPRVELIKDMFSPSWDGIGS